jgi:hypothetical protein
MRAVPETRSVRQRKFNETRDGDRICVASDAFKMRLSLFCWIAVRSMPRTFLHQRYWRGINGCFRKCNGYLGNRLERHAYNPRAALRNIS